MLYYSMMPMESKPECERCKMPDCMIIRCDRCKLYLCEDCFPQDDVTRRICFKCEKEKWGNIR